MPWTSADMPDQHGRVAIVTGANSGLGLVTARELAAHGATVVLACRNLARGQAAAAAMRGGEVEVIELDLGSLDLLICNAGIMAPPRRLTADGFESQFGVNHLGHFALCGRLMERLLAAGEGARVVSVSSAAHRLGRMKWDDLQREHGYISWLAYGQSKLANLLFCVELQRRLTAAGAELLSVAAHPGYAATNLQLSGPRWWEVALMRLTNLVFAQSAEMGALPTLYAATAAEVPAGAFVGPDGPAEARGHPRIVSATPRAYDPEDGRRLWEVSERLTGVSYPL
jgi:NAD(P)-dependent dehydrogenase (short-subunit alcohol dehydrogenase family)